VSVVEFVDVFLGDVVGVVEVVDEMVSSRRY